MTITGTVTVARNPDGSVSFEVTLDGTVAANGHWYGVSQAADTIGRAFLDAAFLERIGKQGVK